MSKFIKTQIVDVDGIVHKARINTTTGEVTKFDRSIPRDRKPSGVMPDLLQDGSLSYVPQWAAIRSEQELEDEEFLILSRKEQDNPNNTLLSGYEFHSDYSFDYPVFDAILTGVSEISTGGNKPLSKILLFKLLRDLPTISTSAISNYTGYTIRYSQKLAISLRVLANAFDREVIAGTLK
jgi:hypothetical protein